MLLALDTFLLFLGLFWLFYVFSAIFSSGPFSANFGPFLANLGHLWPFLNCPKWRSHPAASQQTPHIFTANYRLAICLDHILYYYFLKKSILDLVAFFLGDLDGATSWSRSDLDGCVHPGLFAHPGIF